MESSIQTIVAKDLKNKKITVVREFDAALDLVWRAWTESELLDQWWAPRPWVTETKSLKFEEGGNWLYAMRGPDGNKIWNIIEFKSIQRHQSFHAQSSFCDEKGNKNPEFPSMLWKNVFMPSGTGTKVEVELSFTKESDLQKIVDMGFEAGFTLALANLDELLAK
jgi:uncharacterized protein YndB with AHSA1/START domain